MLLAADHIATEAALKASGLATTILRNGWYTENDTGSLAGSVAAGAMAGAAGDGPLASAARADYAEAVAVVAAGSGHEGKVYELAGDDAFTMAEMAAVVSEVTGKTIPYQRLRKEAYAAMLVSVGLPPPVAEIFADADACAAAGALDDSSRTLSTLIGRPTTPMATTVAAALR